jgi:nucleotide-binding universal stress UspA family protein
MDEAMYKAIMVPIDLAQAEKGKATIEVAKKLSEEGTRIMLINVMGNIPSFVLDAEIPDEIGEVPSDILKMSKEDAHSVLEGMAKTAGVKADVEVRSGSPATAILAAAEEKGTDLIIIASHHPGLQDYLLGSTASRVVRHATCSVLVAR